MRKKFEFTIEDIGPQINDNPVVYQVLNMHDKMIYVGIAKKKDFRNRLRGHLIVASMPIAYFKFEECDSIKEASQKAEKIIAKEKPKYNQYYEIDGAVKAEAQKLEAKA